MHCLQLNVGTRYPQSITAASPVRLVLGLVIFCLLSAQALAESATDTPIETTVNGEVGPHPDLSPQQVVRIQLAVLRGNDDLNRGIEICFRFASPANKSVTGPLPRFVRMIEGGPYSLMLRYQDVVFEPVEIDGSTARQTVTLYGRGKALTFTFFLGRQSAGECNNCWMTESVITTVPGVSA